MGLISFTMRDRNSRQGLNGDGAAEARGADNSEVTGSSPVLRIFFTNNLMSNKNQFQRVHKYKIIFVSFIKLSSKYWLSERDFKLSERCL